MSNFSSSSSCSIQISVSHETLRPFSNSNKSLGMKQSFFYAFKYFKKYCLTICELSVLLKLTYISSYICIYIYIYTKKAYKLKRKKIQE